MIHPWGTAEEIVIEQFSLKIDGRIFFPSFLLLRGANYFTNYFHCTSIKTEVTGGKKQRHTHTIFSGFNKYILSTVYSVTFPGLTTLTSKYLSKAAQKHSADANMLR